MLLIALLANAAGVQEAPKPAIVDPNKKVCRTQESTGSRLGATRVCKSAAKWRQEEADAERGLNEHTRRTTSHPYPQ